MTSDRLRRLAWRIGRKLYCWARGDTINEPSRNGEYWLLAQMMQSAESGSIILDVGANVGDWSRQALTLAISTNKHIEVLAFEPCSATREILRQRLSSQANVEIIPTALSATVGVANFFSNGAGTGTNSLSATSGPESERVQVTTLDTFAQERRIAHVSMMKIDTEGFDFAVLNGSESMLAGGRIDLVQFEYNWRWLLNRASLLDVFKFIEDKPYRFGKLVGDSIDFYDEWHFELDRYFENNYVLVLKGSELERLGSLSGFDANNVSGPVDGMR